MFFFYGVMNKCYKFRYNKVGDNMEKRIVYISYLIIVFVVFNFMYGFTERIRSWQVWNWYLVIVVVLMGTLVFIKYKQNQQKYALREQIKEIDNCRLRLNQLLLFEQFEKLDDEKFNHFLKQFYQLKGYEEIEVATNRQQTGYDLILWRKGHKTMLKWFKNVPLTTSLYTESLNYQFESGDLVSLSEVREAYGAMKDFNVQADELILLSTSGFDEEALNFAQRNQITILEGESFYYALEQSREPQSQFSNELAK